MKKLLSLSLISAVVCTALMVLAACGQEEVSDEQQYLQNLPQSNCYQDMKERLMKEGKEPIYENLENISGKIFYWSHDWEHIDLWVISINPEYGATKRNYITGEIEKDTTLVPCSIPNEFKTEGKQVIISGRRINNCCLLTHPDIRGPVWGFPFEITCIQSLKDR